MDHLGESQLVWRKLLRRNQRLLRTGVVNFDQQQPRFNPRDIQGQHSGSVQIKLLALVCQRVPHLDRVIPRNPDLISQVAGVAGAGDVHRYTCNLATRHAKVSEIRDVTFRHSLQQLAGSWALQRQRRDLLGNVLNLNIHVQAVLPEPTQAGIGGGPAIDVFLEARDRAVVDDLTLLVTPAAVNHLPDLDLVDVARDYTVHQPRRILAGD